MQMQTCLPADALGSWGRLQACWLGKPCCRRCRAAALPLPGPTHRCCAVQARLLGGQKLQGTLTSNEVQEILMRRGWEQVCAGVHGGWGAGYA